MLNAGGLDPAIQAELASVGSLCDAPYLHIAEHGSEALWSKRNRKREVCMVIRHPSGRLLTFTKAFYPTGLYRLPTGGVELGEQVLDALHREMAEETGLDYSVRRLLALIAYRAADAAGAADAADAPEAPLQAFTFAFLLDELGGELGAADAAEQLTGYGEIAVSDLLPLAEQLEHLPDSYSPDLDESWRDWGMYRAIAHRAVWQALHSV